MSSSAPHPQPSLLAKQPQSHRQHHKQKQQQRCLPASTCLQNGNSNPQPRKHQPSPFLRLPSEIRFLIYSYLLPHAHDITFHPLTRKHPSTGAPVPSHAVHIPGIWASIGIWTSLLRTCRQLHAEGADALYGGNRFHFSLTSKERVWAFTPPPSSEEAGDGRARAGGSGGGGGGGGVHALNTPHARGLPVNTLRTSGIGAEALRRMRCVSVRVEEDLGRPEAFRRVQAWLREFVARLNGEEGEGEGAVERGRPAAAQHCLQELRIELVSGVFRYGGFPSFTDSVYWEFLPERNGENGAQWQFVLEPLARLDGIREVRVTGHVKAGFARKLAEKMMTDGRERDEDGMEGIEYGVQKVERRNGPATRSARKFYEPELDWQLEGD
ncbi:hypothetical protein GTA08_BOTSDO07179 [Botryosphaeria dothidea]|uniref:Uncharacterized protein n=1 Tax=Botryosphaeria dothidea TaxID=55169 RepID=A0A8H4IH87_9PEZI|nr:hypothetical protein GTA08_BOTSDO11374 [Botryosphaeria dothidea]KAF4305556.1 hypothetical protein GTA08_BOTSDO07179 [Botryosphaeria dothidea]